MFFFYKESSMKTQRMFGISPSMAGAALCVLSAWALPAMGGVTISDTLYPIDTAPSGDALPTGYTASSAPGYGTSSWETNGNKLELYLSPSALGFSTVTLASTGNNLASVSYWTNKLNAVQGDWYINIYTNTTSSNNAESWYHDRLTFLTADGSYKSSATTNTWTQATTASSSNQLLLTSVNSSSGYTYLSSPEALSAVESSANYDTQTVKYITLTVASNAATLQSLVDGLQFSSGDGSTATFNLEAATPIPGTGLLAAVGSLTLIGGLALRRRLAAKL
jgi:hypothetical protein